MMISRKEECFALLASAVTEALNAMGETAVAAVRGCMADGYAQPVRESGALMADVQYRQQDGTVAIGNTLDYAGIVHDGTHRMPGRPYLTDGILGNAEEIFRTGGQVVAGHY